MVMVRVVIRFFVRFRVREIDIIKSRAKVSNLISMTGLAAEQLSRFNSPYPATPFLDRCFIPI